MLKALFFSFFLIFCFSTIFAQVTQVDRFELEMKNSDDFSTVIASGDKGLFIIRDTNIPFSFEKKVKGNFWEVMALDTAFQELWKHELEVDFDYLFKGYEISQNKVHLLFRDGEFVKNNYLLMTFDLTTGEKVEYEIENEIAVDLSHIIVVDEVLILAGYVRNSPTLVSYQIGKEKLIVIPGFFKDKSEILDLRSNDNGTFNVLTLEKGYEGSLLRLRTHAYDGVILFEREIGIDDDYRILSGRSTGFVNGNFAVTGSYGGRFSYYSRGIFFAIVKPEGQENTLNLIDFTEMQHFFDYMRPKRAERIKRRIERKQLKGKDYKYLSRILINNIITTKDGFLVSAEVYDPEYQRANAPELSNSYFNQNQNFQPVSNRYVRQPNRLINVNDAQEFEYLESIILSINKKGELNWDQNFTIDDVKLVELKPVVDVSKQGDLIKMLYKSEEEISYKILVNPDSTMTDKVPLKLKYNGDEIQHTYDLIGGTKHWYGDYFFVWGNHRVGNKEDPAIDNRRKLLYINKVKFD